MIAPFIVFFASLGVAFFVMAKRQIPFWLVSKRLEDAVRQRGLQSFIGEKFWHLKMLIDAKAIFCDSDTPDMRALKQECFDRYQAMMKALPVALAVATGGLVLSALVTWLGYFLKGQP
jgi:hypothetical protein